MPNLSRSFIFFLLALLLLASGALSACSAVAEDHTFAMASMDDIPADVQSAPVSVQQAYQFAFANPDVMTEIPCYCGCGAMGHTSDYSCYVSNVSLTARSPTTPRLRLFHLRGHHPGCHAPAQTGPERA